MDFYKKSAHVSGSPEDCFKNSFKSHSGISPRIPSEIPIRICPDAVFQYFSKYFSKEYYTYYYHNGSKISL